MGRKLDYYNVLNSDETYIHSHAKHFKKSFKDNFSSELGDVKGAILEMKNAVLKEIEEERQYFLALEERLVQDAVAKYKLEKDANPPFSDRKTYLRHLNEMREHFESTDSYHTYSLVQFKKTMINSNKISEGVFQKLKKLDLVAPTKDEIEKAQKRYNETGSARHEKRFKNATADRQRILNRDKKATDKAKKELKAHLDSVDKEMRRNADALAQYFADVVEYTKSLYDAQEIKEIAARKRKKLDTTISKTMESFNKTIDSFGINLSSKERKESKESVSSWLREKFQKSIVEGGAHMFTTTFHNAVARKYLEHQVQAFQTSSRLGFLYEDAVRQAIQKQLEEGGTYASLYLNQKDVKGVGQISYIRQLSTMDLQINSVKPNKNMPPVNIGMSVKLKDYNSNIKLESSKALPELAWNKINNILGEDEMEKYQYLRKNLLALSINDPADFTLSLNQFFEYEKALYTIVLLSRFLIGLFERLDGQYKMAGADKDQEVYYTAYLYGLGHVYSTSDLLGELLKLFKGDIESFSDTIEGKFNFKLDTKGKQSMPKKSTLQELLNAKTKVWKDIARRSGFDAISYEKIYGDIEVKKLLTEINKGLGEHSYQGKSSPNLSITPSQIEKILK